MSIHNIFPHNNFYKANLHCHSTLSDGRKSPEELKEIYRQNGYSVLSITDHEFLIDQQHLNEKDFIFINGYEISIMEKGKGTTNPPKVCHLNLFARDPSQRTQVCFNPKMVKPGMQHYPTPPSIPPVYEMIYSVDCINDIIRIASENGFMVAYNHPEWSLEDARIFTQYQGLFAMEVFNYGSYMLGIPEYNIQAYDAMIRSGHRLYCMAGDDNHNKHPLADPLSDSFGGWIMINAAELTYANIISSLEKGLFYASTGVDIHDIYVKDGTLHLSCSPCKRIAMTTYGRAAGLICAEKGKLLTDAQFQLKSEYICVRFELTGIAGEKAYTQAYWIDDIPETAMPR